MTLKLSALASFKVPSNRSFLDRSAGIRNPPRSIEHVTGMKELSPNLHAQPTPKLLVTTPLALLMEARRYTLAVSSSRTLNSPAAAVVMGLFCGLFFLTAI